MIATSQQFSVLIEELSGATWTLAAIGLLFDSGLADQLREARTLDELAARCPGCPANGSCAAWRWPPCAAWWRSTAPATSLAPGALPSLEPGPRAVLAGDLRSPLLQAAAYLRAAGDPASPGWRHTDPADPAGAGGRVEHVRHRAPQPAGARARRSR